MTTSGNERQRVVQRMAAGGTASDNEWQRVTINESAISGRQLVVQ